MSCTCPPAECAALISAAKAAGIALSAETCPHYLFFAAEEVPDGATEFKCCPPVRYAVNREALWRGLGDGAIDCIVSDHSPCPPTLRPAGRGLRAPRGAGSRRCSSGCPSCGRGTTARVLARRRGRGGCRLAPPRWPGCRRRGGSRSGATPTWWRSTPTRPGRWGRPELLHRHPVTPYDGRTLTGRVRATWLGGAE